MTSDRWLELGVLAALQSCMLILLVLAVRGAVARWLGARWAYYLWLVPLLALLAIALPTHWVRAFGLPVIDVPAAQAVFEAASAASEPVLAVWVLGFVLTLLAFVISSVRFSIRTRRTSRELTFDERTVVRDRCARLARRVEVDFRLLQTAQGPAVAGFVQPVLLLPVDFFHRYSPRQQTLMLSHELQHLCRRDLMVLLLARLYRCLFWFNPLAWLADRCVRLDQELSCDERVLACENSATRRVYGEAMLLAVHNPSSAGQAGYPPPFGQLKRRAALLRHHRSNLLASALGALLLLGAVGGGVIFGALGALERDLAVRPELRSALAVAATPLDEESTDWEALVDVPARLVRHESTYYDPPLNDYERAEVASLIALAWFRLGHYERALETYRRVMSLAKGIRDLEARVLIDMADVHYAQGDYTEALKALVRSETVDPRQYTPETWALRGLALAKMKLWDQALICLSRAIEQAEAKGGRPDERWLLARTALLINRGEVEDAARSLDAAMVQYPETSYEKKLQIFNEFVQESWEPRADDELAARF